ncbi:MAG: M56 family metallopeptidase [Myxococcota bacterium]
MSNFLHHILAAAWSFALVAGLLTVTARAVLHSRLDHIEHPAEFDTPLTYLALVIPGLLPLVWLGSGLVHLEESGALMEACCSILAISNTSWQHWVFASGATLLLAAQGLSLWRRWRPAHENHDPTSLARAIDRVDAIVTAHPQLLDYSDAIHVVDCDAHICATVGIVNQRVEVAASLVEQLDEDALEAALLHEVAHISLRDPARGFVLLISQILNPFSWLLSSEAAAWRFAREVVCDRHAVLFGARPVSVADAIVTTAKASSSAPRRACAHLCGARDTIAARVNLLLSSSDQSRRFSHAGSVPALGSLMLLAGLVLPHILGARVISFHCLLEETLSTLTFLF